MFGFKKTRRQPIANRQSRIETLERRTLFARQYFRCLQSCHSRSLTHGRWFVEFSHRCTSRSRRHSYRRSRDNDQWRREHCYIRRPTSGPSP